MKQITQNDLAHAKDMIRVYTDSIVKNGKPPTLHVVEYSVRMTRNGNARRYVKVLAAFEPGAIMDITRYVAIIGNYTQRKDGCIVVNQLSEPVDTVAKSLGIQSLKTEIL